MEALLPALEELVQINNDKIAKLGDTIFFTCIKYEKIDLFQLILFDIFSPFEDTSEEIVIQRLRKMNENDDDDLLTVSKNCRPILEHKLVS
jgi:hypothetical protein